MNKFNFFEHKLIENKTTLFFDDGNKIIPVLFLYAVFSGNHKKIFFLMNGEKRFCSANSDNLFFSEEDARKRRGDSIDLNSLITTLDKKLIFESDKIPAEKVKNKTLDYYKEEKEHLEITCSYVKKLIQSEKNKLDNCEEEFVKYNKEIIQGNIEDAEYHGYYCFNNHFVKANIIKNKIEATKVETDRNVERLNKIFDNAYFGRVDFLLDGKEYTIYIGETELENKIYQWQDTLIGDIYYNTERFLNYSNFKVTLRRNIKVKQDNLIEVLNSDLSIFNSKQDARDRNLACASSSTTNDSLNKSLADKNFEELIEERRKEGTIHGIASSMKTNQYNIASYDVDKNIIVEGCPGSGKTMIMFERISFIDYLFNHRTGKIYLITPSQVFENLYEDLANKHNIANLEYSSYLKFLKTICFEVSEKNRILPFLDIDTFGKCKSKSFGYTDDSLLFNRFSEIYEQTEVSSLNFAYWLANYIYFYLDDVGVKKVKKEDLCSYGKLSKVKLREIIEQMNLKARIEENFLEYSYENFLHTVSDNDYAKGVVNRYKEVITYLTGKNTVKTNGGRIKKVPYIKDLILNKSFEKIIQVLLGNKVITIIDNVMSKKEDEKCAFIAKCYFALYKLKKENNLLGDHYLFELEYILRLMGLKFGPISTSKVYMFIDEFQNYTKFELETLRLLFPNSIINLFGDTRQRFNFNGIKEKKQLTSVFDFDYFEINQNVRNAKEITDYVNKLLGTKMIPINVKGCVKEILKSRVVFKKNGRTAIISKNIDKVKKCIGFIIPDIYNFVERTNVIDKKCINVFDVQSVKGLEFDTVYVFMDGLSEEEKYVSLTRGLHNLYVVI